MFIRRLTPSDTAAFQGIRLLGLQEAPAAFGSSYEEEAHRSVDDVASRLTQTSEQAVIGAFVDEALVGVAGVRRQNLLKYRHKAALWGVYVHPGHRGVSISRKLVDAAMAFAQAMPGVMQVTLTVTKGNVAAAGLYRSLGFEVFGEERNGLFADGIMHDEIHMARVFLSAADVMTHAKIR